MTPLRNQKQQATDSQKFVDLALQYHKAGDLTKAEDLYKQALQANPNNVVALHMMGLIAHQVGNNEIAVDLINKALDENPNLAEVHNNLGLALVDLGKLQEATVSFLNALTINPNYSKAHYNLGNTLKKQGDLDEAIDSYKKALVYDPDDAEAHRSLGHVYKELGDFDRAVANHLKSLAKDNDNAEEHYSLGVVLYDMGRLKECASCFSKAFAIDPKLRNSDNTHPQSHVTATSQSVNQLNNLFISTIPRSGTHFLMNIMHNLAALYGEPERDDVRLVDQKAPATALTKYVNLGLQLFGVGHMLCPRASTTLKGNQLEKWNALSCTNDTYWPFPGKFKEDSSLRDLVIKGGGFDLSNPQVRLVFVFRNPLDHFVSIHNHMKNHKDGYARGYIDNSGTFRFFADITDLIFNWSLDSYLKLYTSYVWSLPKYSNQIKLVSYESFVLDPLEGMKGILEFVGSMPDYDIISTELHQALDFCTPESLQLVENELGTTLAGDQIQTSGLGSHIRDGGTGKWKGLVNDNTIEKIERRFNEYGFSLNDFETGM